MSEDKPCILIVEDEIETRTILAMAFSYWGYPLLVAADGYEALRLAQDHPVDVALLDVVLIPGPSGLELAQRLREINPYVLIIVMSAYVSAQDAIEATNQGALYYLPKPCTPSFVRGLVDAKWIDEFAIDRSNPDEFQAARSGQTVYVRRPTHYGDEDWHVVLTKSNVETLVGTVIHGLKWVEINAYQAGHIYVTACEGLNALSKRFWLIKSQDYGSTWTVHPVYGGVIRAYGAVWAGRDILYAAVNTGLGGSANIYYSSDEGLSWGKKSGLGSSVWMPRVLVDPTDQAVSYAGYGFNGPELVKATAVSGGYSQIDGDYQAGIAIYYGYGTGWISSLDGRYVRTSRGGYLYFSDDGGATWNRSLGAFEGGIWGDDDAPNNMITARDESGELNSPHILKSTTNLGLDWHNKGGAHATLPIQVVVILFPITVAG